MEDYIQWGMILILGTALLGMLRKWNRMKRKRQEILSGLQEIREGNGNRRLLAFQEDALAPLVFEINEIVEGYEKRIAELKRTEEANRQLMTDLSHDVRTPLTTLIGYLDTVCRGLVRGEEREGYMETARKKAYDLKEYIDVLFDWFQINSGRFALRAVPIHILEQTRKLLIDFIPVFEELGMEYEIEIPDGPVRVSVDADGYERILNNLLQNVIVHSRAKKVCIKARVEKQSFLVNVWDDGIGIEPGELRHIFERLYKCDKGRLGRGSGLGLSIAKEMAESMGGRIEAESEKGRFTSFTVVFPVIREDGSGCKIHARRTQGSCKEEGV